MENGFIIGGSPHRSALRRDVVPVEIRAGGRGASSYRCDGDIVVEGVRILRHKAMVILGCVGGWAYWGMVHVGVCE